MFDFNKKENDSEYEGIKPITPLRELYEDIKDKQIESIAYIIICFIVSTFLSGFFYQYIITLFNDKPIFILSSFKYGLTKSIIFTLILLVLLVIGGFRIYRSFKKSYLKNYDDNYLKSKNETFGSAHFQTDEELSEHFNIHESIEDTTGHLFGRKKDTNEVCEFVYPRGMNENKVAIGSPGSGKSAAIIKTDLYQAMRRGDSVICTDSKGAIYAETSATAREMGYIVRVLNLKNTEFRNSDGFNVFASLDKNDETLDSQAAVIANAIITNTQTREVEYWGPNEFNLLKAIIMLLARDDIYLSNGQNNLPYIAEFLNNSPEKMKSIFTRYPKGDPIRSAYDLFAQAEQRNQGQIINGLGIRIATLSNPVLREVLSHNEIDLVLPMKKKCIYYLIISDTDETYKYISSIFFSAMFNQQCIYSDRLTNEQKKLQKRVVYLMDEYKATGGISTLPNLISVTRSRKISITIILQTKGQLYSMYEENAADNILGCCPVKVLLATDDLATAEYFETLMGDETVVTESQKITESSADIFHSQSEVKKTFTENKRSLLSAADILNGKLSRNEILYIIGGMPPVRLNKCFAEMSGTAIHPLEKRSHELGQKMPHRYKPRWRKLKEEAAAKEKEELEKKRQESKKETLPQNTENTQASTNEPKEEKPKRTYKRTTIKKDDTISSYTSPVKDANSDVPASEVKKSVSDTPYNKKESVSQTENLTPDKKQESPEKKPTASIFVGDSLNGITLSEIKSSDLFK